MKKQILILLGILISLSAPAQIRDSGQYGFTKITTKENENMNKVHGSPYLNDDFTFGTVTIKDKEPLKVFMRYDVLKENIEIKTDRNSEDVYVLPLAQKAEYSIGPDKFIHDKITHEGNTISGYFREHYNGDNVRLLEKPSVTVTEAVKAKTGYDRDRPAEIIIEEEYYIVFDSGEVENVRLKKKDLRKVFTSKEARNYLSDNRIRSVEDVVFFLSYSDGKKMH